MFFTYLFPRKGTLTLTPWMGWDHKSPKFTKKEFVRRMLTLLGHVSKRVIFLSQKICAYIQKKTQNTINTFKITIYNTTHTNNTKTHFQKSLFLFFENYETIQRSILFKKRIIEIDQRLMQIFMELLIICIFHILFRDIYSRGVIKSQRLTLDGGRACYTDRESHSLFINRGGPRRQGIKPSSPRRQAICGPATEFAIGASPHIPPATQH